MNKEVIGSVLVHFTSPNLPLGPFIVHILSEPDFSNHPAVLSLRQSAFEIKDALSHEQNISNALPPPPTLEREIGLSKAVYRQELEALIQNQDSWRFSAARATIERLEEFKVEEMASTMEREAPHLWSLLYDLFSRGESTSAGEGLRSERGHWEGMDRLWEYVEGGDIGEMIGVVTGTPAVVEDRLQRRRSAIKRIKIVVIISILMQTLNQKVNALPSIIGVFLHASKTPERVIDALSRMGISISMSSIHNAITSLSAQSALVLRQLAQSLLIAYAYDNFDIDLQSKVPTLEKGNSPSLKHLTSALVFPLQHGVTKDDLKCSDYLWRRSHLNPKARQEDRGPSRTWRDLVNLHREESKDGEPTRRVRFNAWKILRDLLEHGPPYFRRFLDRLEDPEPVEKIPLVKTPIYPARAMEHSNSTVSGNINTLLDLAKQGGIGDLSDPEILDEVEDIGDHVVMIHGDLGTGDRIDAIRLRRSIEETPWRRFQWVVFVPGFFHLKMACVDAIWRIFIQSPEARHDDSSLMRDAAKLRPRETGKITTNPGYRRMLEIIQHTGICRRLDCWVVEAQSRFGTPIKSLEDLAMLEPSFDVLEDMALRIARTYVAGPKLNRLRNQPPAQRDKQFENSTLFNKYSLIGPKSSYAAPP